MSSKTRDLVIVFADVAGSTHIYDTFGDTQSRQLIAEILDLLSGVITSYNGRVIKTIGDEVMCTFPDAESAGDAVCDMHEVVEAGNESSERITPVSIRIGLHYGPVLLEAGDVYGDAVNVAARMAAQAKARQIVTTRTTADAMSAAMRENTRFVDHALIKGKGRVEIVELLWQKDDVTHMNTFLDTGQITGDTLSIRLRHKGTEIILDQDNRAAVLGRSPVCDVRVEENLASRQHVRLEIRRDKYFIIDQSTNGTYVRVGDSAEAFLRREEMPLTESAAISLGRPVAEESEEIVHIAYQSSA